MNVMEAIGEHRQQERRQPRGRPELPAERAAGTVQEEGLARRIDLPGGRNDQEEGLVLLRSHRRVLGGSSRPMEGPGGRGATGRPWGLVRTHGRTWRRRSGSQNQERS